MQVAPTNEAQMNCFIFAKEYVRVRLGISSEHIPDHKILRFCQSKDNDVKETKIAIKTHLKYMRKIDLKRIAKIPIEKFDFGDRPS